MTLYQATKACRSFDQVHWLNGVLSSFPSFVGLLPEFLDFSHFLGKAISVANNKFGLAWHHSGSKLCICVGGRQRIATRGVAISLGKELCGAYSEWACALGIGRVF